jgi:hypothetical protein
MADMGRFDQFNRRLAYDRFRRISPIAVRPGKGPLTEPRAGAQFGGGNFLHACL